MKSVLDVNVALKWVLNEVDSTKARRLRDNCGSRSTICYIAPVEQLGVLATLSRWRPRVQIPSGALEEEGKADCHKEFVIPQTRRLGTGEPRWS